MLLNVSIGLCLIVPTAGAVICDAFARAIISANDPFFGGAFGVSAIGVMGDPEFELDLPVPRYGIAKAEVEVARVGLCVLNGEPRALDTLFPPALFSFNTLVSGIDKSTSALRFKFDVTLCAPGRALGFLGPFVETLAEVPALTGCNEGGGPSPPIELSTELRNYIQRLADSGKYSAESV